MKTQHWLLASLIYFGIASGPVFAADADSRIQRLEETVSALERRVASLEAQLHERPAAASQVAPDKANWRKLQRGLTEKDVEQLLGSPEQVDASQFVVMWQYAGFGYVRFDGRSHTVDSWSEPSQPTRLPPTLQDRGPDRAPDRAPDREPDREPRAGRGFPSAEDFYPRASKRLGESGAPVVHACVGADGTLTEKPTIVMTSASARLDEAAIRLATAGSGHYMPAIKDGQPIPQCFSFMVRFNPDH
jgi:hypothetical protein